DNIERTVLPRLEPICVSLGADDQVRPPRAVENLRDALVGVGMRQNLGLEKSTVRIAGAVPAASRGLQRFFDRGARERGLVGEWVLADLLDHPESQWSSRLGVAFEPDHAPA